LNRTLIDIFRSFSSSAGRPRRLINAAAFFFAKNLRQHFMRLLRIPVIVTGKSA
jgi:hypothetical protein